MTRTSLEEIRRLATEATPGPWTTTGRNGARGHFVWHKTSVVCNAHRWSPPGSPPQRGPESVTARGNAYYIASVSPPVVLALLDELEALRELHEAVIPVRTIHLTVMQEALMAQVTKRIREALARLDKLDSLRGDHG